MFSPLRNRLGIPGVISVIALVFAMLGGAYAANSSSDNGKATASAKAKKGPRGPKGATGPAGPAGPQGPAGAKGDSGAAGANGTNGTNGSPGAPGQSVTTATEPPEANCGEQEGVKLTSVSGTKYVCNGANGAKGDPGDPWTAGGTLPSGKTETGSWAFGLVPGAAVPSSINVAISFPIRLPAAIGPGHTHYINAAGQEVVLGFNEETEEEELELVTPTACGSAIGVGVNSENPQAKPGELCVYEATMGNATLFSNFSITKIGNSVATAWGASSAGALLRFVQIGASAQGFGTWAVTAP